MKKFILSSILLSSLTICFAQDLTRYQDVRFVKEISVTQPTIVEIKNLSSIGNYVITDDSDTYIEQQSQITRSSNITLPLRAEGCTDICRNAVTLADGNPDTTFDFPLLSSGVQKGKIKILYAKAIETDSITFQTTNDSYAPTTFTLVIDGTLILNTIQGKNVRFPKMMAQSIEIEFEYNQPIRFTEVGIGFNKEENSSNTLRFVYKPDVKYILYLNSPTGRESIPSPAINLFAKSNELEVELESIRKNPLYKERDTDSDGVIDSVDNCPLQVNPDQKDGNANNIGDVCDDYDYDGVVTFRDNCPFIENPDQKDTDNDGIGDKCDNEESRATEKYPWMPWVIFIGVFLAVIAMGYEVIKMKKIKEAAKV